jgi:hypothetical protein
MSDPQGVKAIHRETTGTVVTGAFYLKAYHCISGGTAGDVIFRDGGASGAVVAQFNIGTGTQPVTLLIPNAGILFETDLHVTLPATAKITSFYGR